MHSTPLEYLIIYKRRVNFIFIKTSLARLAGGAVFKSLQLPEKSPEVNGKIEFPFLIVQISLMYRGCLTLVHNQSPSF